MYALRSRDKFARDCDEASDELLLYACPDLIWGIRCGELTHGLDGTNATMTRETWSGGTYSHAWGTGAITGVAGGLMGIVQTAPAFANFTVKPRIGR